MGGPPKIGGFPPKSSILIGVFHYFHHPFWGFSPYFWFNTHMGWLVFLSSFSVINRMTFRNMFKSDPDLNRLIRMPRLQHPGVNSAKNLGESSGDVKKSIYLSWNLKSSVKKLQNMLMFLPCKIWGPMIF